MTRSHCIEADRLDVLLSDRGIDALISRVWEDPLEAFVDTDREDLRTAIREAVASAAGQEKPCP